MADDPIYLDHNATTPLLPEVVDAMLPYLREHFGNPSSGHVYGKRARAAVDQARDQVAALLGCRADEIVFTSGGTEANNLAIRGSAACSTRRHLVTSVVEHPATTAAVAVLASQGWRATALGVDAQGQLAPQSAEITSATGLLTLMLANNETGALQPVADLAEAARAVGAVVHTDAAQALGKVPVDVHTLGVDLLSVAGHKLYAPKGVGALYVRAGTRLAPLVVGGGHERGLRPGTESVAALVALGQACVCAAQDLLTEGARQADLRDRLHRALAASVPDLRLHGPVDARLPNTLNVGFPGVLGAAVLAATPDVAASTGSACHEGHHTPSTGLLAMGLTPDQALSAVRLTLGRKTTATQVDHAATALIRAWHSLQPARG
jgi:cysteine desulfurase